jgi:hypothetical protein
MLRRTSRKSRSKAQPDEQDTGRRSGGRATSAPDTLAWCPSSPPSVPLSSPAHSDLDTQPSPPTGHWVERRCWTPSAAASSAGGRDREPAVVAALWLIVVVKVIVALAARARRSRSRAIAYVDQGSRPPPPRLDRRHRPRPVRRRTDHGRSPRGGWRNRRCSGCPPEGPGPACLLVGSLVLAVGRGVQRQPARPLASTALVCHPRRSGGCLLLAGRAPTCVQPSSIASVWGPEPP